MFYLSGAGLPRLSWKKAVKHMYVCRGCFLTAPCVLVLRIWKRGFDSVLYDIIALAMHKLVSIGSHNEWEDNIENRGTRKSMNQ